MGEDTTLRVSKDLADELYQRKGRTTSYEDYLWELLERVDRLEDEEGGEAPSQNDISTHSSSRPTERREEPPDPDATPRGGDAETTLRDLDLPGSGSKFEQRVAAVVAMYDYLQDHPGERVSKGDLEEVLEERDIDPGYASFNSLWSNWVKSNEGQGRSFNTLTELPGVAMDGDDYVYREGV